MFFLGKIIKGFKEAAKAGADFNPVLESVMKKIEDLHAQGILDETLYQAEESYKAEHAEYVAKGLHTNAIDSQNELLAIKHFMNALQDSLNTLDPSLKDEAQHLLELRDAMMNILGDAFKK